eukprot:814651-Pleurochrysis_carterae.AAC.1
MRPNSTFNCSRSVYRDSDIDFASGQTPVERPNWSATFLVCNIEALSSLFVAAVSAAGAPRCPLRSR